MLHISTQKPHMRMEVYEQLQLQKRKPFVLYDRGYVLHI